ncbi:hypothetical protein [Paraburkholderia atlantica]|uniref:hypothetical protein n=1 Tax=Paraburkholderia atlantica TaxID=2654982 RepID=UPI00187B574A|nr:hypothetical protein [Paraburkholderia atlantica]
MEKWLVILGLWVMCAACAVFFIRGATRSSNRREQERKQASVASRGSAGDAQNVLND